MTTKREGGCACGAVRYRLTSDPLVVHCCHCLNCQRQTGSAFVVNLLIETDRVELLSGDPQPVDAPRDDGSVQRVFRCPTCQVAVFSQYTRPEVRFVRGGTLDDPSSVEPDVHIFTRSKLPWVVLARVDPGLRRLLRHERPLARGEPRAARGDHDAFTRRRLTSTTPERRGHRLRVSVSSSVGRRSSSAGPGRDGRRGRRGLQAGSGRARGSRSRCTRSARA